MEKTELTIKSLLANLAAVTTDLQSVSEIETQAIESEVQFLEEIIEKVKSIVPYIHNNIVIFDNERWTNNGWCGKKVTSRERIVIIEEREDEGTDDAMHYDNEIIVWMLSDAGVALRVKGHREYSRYQNSYSEYSLIEGYDRETEALSGHGKNDIQDLFDPTPITIKELVEDIGFKYIIQGLIKRFNDAIDANKNKRIQLQSRLDQLEAIRALL